MRNVLRRKPFHRLLLSTAIASLISIPAAFAHSHHNVGSDAGPSGRSMGHSEPRHHGDTSFARSGKNNSHHSRRGQAVAESSESRNRVHVPDEEELQQPEL